MTHVTCRLTAKNRDQLRNPTLSIEYGLPLPLPFTFIKVFYSLQLTLRERSGAFLDVRQNRVVSAHLSGLLGSSL